MAKLKAPLVLINFKTYESSTGKNAVKLAKACEKAAGETGASIAVAVQAADICAVSSAVSIPVLAQHIDNIEYGANTGKVLANAVKENGAVGTLLNHSEKRIPLGELKESIARAKSAGLIVVACAKDDGEGREISSFNPDFVAVEPPELIGGDISVSTAQPGLIKDSVEKIGKNVLVGAGVKTTEDVRVSIGLGAAGVLVASGVTKAKDPEKEVRNLVEGLKK
jgi:triosephosphate isomerase